MAGTGANNANPTDPIDVGNFPAVQPVSDDGGSLTVDGTVDVGNLPDFDGEYEILCDDNGPFLRSYKIDATGTVTTVDTLLDGTTGYATVGTVRVCPLDEAGPLDVAITGQPISVDDNGGSLTVDDGGGSLTVDGTVDVGNFPDDSEAKILCDNQGGNPLVVVRFLRRYDVDTAGVVTTVDTELDGTTAYVPSGTVEDCGESGINTVTIEGGAEQSGFGGVAVATRVFGDAGPDNTYTTDANARRVSIYWTSTASSLGNRATIQINAGPVVPLANAIGDVALGTLGSSDVMGYTITVETNQNNDDLLVVEEF